MGDTGYWISDQQQCTVLCGKHGTCSAVAWTVPALLPERSRRPLGQKSKGPEGQAQCGWKSCCTEGCLENAWSYSLGT